jgi:peptide deformylase
MESLKIIRYPHPALRHVSKPLKRIDPGLREIVARMFELMYQHNGVGLAANQVDLPYRLFIANPKGDAKTGQEFVFINPVLSKSRGLAEAEEGCLSLPGLYAQVKRAEKVDLDAYDLEGQSIHMELDGLFARVAQHETDHIDGKLFIDRLSTTGEISVQESLRTFEAEFSDARRRGEILDDAKIAARLAELEQLRT